MTTSVKQLTRALPVCEGWRFDRGEISALGKAHHRAYLDAAPYAHAVIDGLLGEALSLRLAHAFPPADHPSWKRRDYAEQSGRMGQLQRAGFEDVAPELYALLGELISMAFLDFLAALTGRRDLIADPHYTGAGPMATVPGGHLSVHVDFNRDSARKLDRAVSILYYLPVRWDEAWGGELELWDRARLRCEKRIAPIRDRLVILSYGEDHWHGHPTPLACPQGVMRAVVAAHYYAARGSAADDADAHGARW